MDLIVRQPLDHHDLTRVDLLQPVQRLRLVGCRNGLRDNERARKSPRILVDLDFLVVHQRVAVIRNRLSGDHVTHAEQIQQWTVECAMIGLVA